MRLGFMASGRGSNIDAILQSCVKGDLAAEPVLIISNHADSGALKLAGRYHLAAYYLSSKTHPDGESLDLAITNTMLDNKIDLVVLAGYMKKVGPHLLKRFENKILNIHPSLLPKYGGKGMYGMHVHEAVIKAGETESGATIHIVNDEYDRGRILQQAKVSVSENDTPQTLAKKVLAIEHTLYSDTLDQIISGEIKL